MQFLKKKELVSVISHNYFLRLGLISLSEGINVTLYNRAYFLDVESFSSLYMIKKFLNDLDENQAIIFILGKGLLSRQFKNINALHIAMPLDVVKELVILENINSISKSDWISVINSILRLQLLTKTQKKIFNLIKCGLPLTEIANLLKINVKTCYSHSEKIRYVYNINSLPELYLFAQNYTTFQEQHRLMVLPDSLVQPIKITSQLPPFSETSVRSKRRSRSSKRQAKSFDKPISLS